MTNAKLKRMGFVSAKDREVLARLIISVTGMEKQGKTHFGLTAPAPIGYFSIDVGEEGVIGKFQDREIYVMDVARASGDPEETEKEYERFEKAYYDLLRGDEVRTIVIDTATEIWELLRMARFGENMQIMPYQYGPVNKEFRIMINEAFKYDKNLILLHKMKKQYTGSGAKASWNGQWERAGFNGVPYLVQLNARIWRYDPADGGNFVLTIEDSRHDPDMAGVELEEDLCNFPMLATMIMPDVDPEVWE